ncbi:MAG TPA: glycosyltransferase family 4 protein [Gemmatimonadales bacterium]|nr:glycosyltransferase family 4 protein [Gemmatimonadales bacterium]
MDKPEPMRVLITLHQGGGAGAVNSTLHLALGLVARGVHVRLVCPPGSWVEGEAKRGGLEVHPVELVSRRRWPNARKLLEVIHRHPVDLINAQSSRDREALTFLALMGRLSVPLVFTRRSWPRTTRLETWLANRAADRVIALSEPVRAELERQGFGAEKLVVVHNGVLTDRIDRPVNEEEVDAWRRRIGWEPGRRTVGIVARHKDQQVVLAALARVETPVRLVLSGLSPEALALPLPAIPERHAVVRLPFDPEVRPLYDLLEVALHPSRWDALPQAVLEAMALGKPVIASRATGNEVIIRHGLDGLLAAPDDPSDWARQLESLLADPQLAARLGAAACRRAREDFSLEEMFDRTLAVYRSLVRGSVAPLGMTASSQLLLAYDFPPRGGGIARALGEIVRHSHAELEVCTGRISGDEEWDGASGLPITRAPVSAERLRTLGGLIQWGRAADRVIRARRPAFIWAGNLKPAGHVARWLGATRRIPYGLIVYGLDLAIVSEQARRSARKRRRVRMLFRDAAGIVACSEWTAGRCRALLDQLGLGGVAGLIRVIPLGADPRRFSPDGRRYPLPQGRWLLTVARLVPHKGVDTGIRALASLHERFPDLQYAVAGTGPDRERLAALATDLGVSDRLVFLGPVPDEDLPSLYRSATVYLGLSRESGNEVEGFGLSLVEAQASGCPVIAVKSGGVPDAVADGESGILVPPSDAAAAARAIAALLEDDGRRAALGAAGRRRVEERLNWERVVAELRQASEEFRSRRAATVGPGGR